MKQTIFDKEVPGTKFEKVMMKIQNFVLKMGIVAFIFLIIRFIFPDFVQSLIDNLFVPIVFILIAFYFAMPEKKKDNSEMSSKVRYEKTAELDRMIESEKQQTIF